MIRRKLINMNNFSFLITLPKDWIDFNKFSKGI